MSIEVVPMTVKEAKRRVKQWHRKLEDMTGGMFAAGISEGGELRGVAVAGNGARVWNAQGKLVISRVAVEEREDGKGVRNGCSRLYAALSRAAEALGWREVWTYTLPSEPGSSLVGAGFENMGLTKPDANWGRRGRPRDPAKLQGEKVRWRKVLRPERKAEERRKRATIRGTTP